MPRSLLALVALSTLVLAACQSGAESPNAPATDTGPARLEPAGPPAPGDAAPAFSLVSNEGTPVELASLRGRWVVLYFYPKDFTSGCTIEARNFQRDLAEYETRGAVILGVSKDDAETHSEFCAREGLAFKLLADTDGVVSGAYGSLREGSGLSARNTFVIDPDGVVAKTYVGVDPNVHSPQVLADLAALQGA